MRLKSVCRVLIVGFALFAGRAHADLQIQSYDADRHDRFTNSSDFIGNPYDWSGVGRLAGGGKWATMISPSYFLAASHAHPAPMSMVRFYESNNSSGPFEDHTVASGQQIAGSDLWLGKLKNPVSAEIHPFPIVAPANLSNQEIYVMGQSGSTGMRLGRNVIDEVLPGFSHMDLGASQGDVFVFDYDTVHGLGQDESRFRGGDSGGPSFAIVDGEPAIVGIHWFTYDIDDAITPEVGSGDTLVSSYLTQLTSATVGESLTVVSVPEPAGVWLMSVVTLLAIYKSKLGCRTIRGR